VKHPYKLFRRAGDVVNPIVVKELRQAVQGRFVMGVLVLFLLVSVSAMWLNIMSIDPTSVDTGAGREAFFQLWGVLLFTCLLFIPGYTGIRMMNERIDENADLMFITTLKPGAIIRGKFVSAVILAILIFSACMPFITLTYLLRGIDLLSIFLFLGFSMFMVLCGIGVLLFLACLPTSKSTKTLLIVGSLLVMMIFVFQAHRVADNLLRFGFGGIISTWQFWAPVLSFLAVVMMGMGLLYVLSVALITPPPANRALPIRLYITAICILSGVLARAWSLYDKDHTPMEYWAMGSVILLCLAILGGVSERDSLGPRVARTIPRRRFLRIPIFFFYSGGASGVLWAVVMIAGVLIVLDQWRQGHPLFRLPRDFRDNLDYLIAFGCYFISYSLTALFLREHILGRRLRLRPGITWVIAILTMMVLSIVPLLIAFFSQIDLTGEDAYVWFLANPASMTSYKRHMDTFLIVSGAWAGISLLLSLPWFIRQIAAFKPYSSRVPQETA